MILFLILYQVNIYDDTDYVFLQAALHHLFKANVNRNLYEDRYLIPDYQYNFIYYMCAMSKSKQKVAKLGES
jgi:hypothetical protein